MIKIVERTEDRVRLVSKPSWWWALAFAAFGLMMLFQGNAGWVMVIVGFGFLFLSIAILAQKEECLLDKCNDLVLLKRAPFPFSREQYRLSDVASFFVSGRHQMPNRYDDEIFMFVVEMRLKSGLEIPLCGCRSSLKWKQRQDIVAVLESFRKPDHAPSIDDNQSLASAPAHASEKICTICRLSCGNAPRLKDDQGNYYHSACYNGSNLKAV